MIVTNALTLLRYSAAAALLCVSAVAFGQVQTLDKVVAIVDDDIILASELQESLERLRAGLTARGVDMPEEEVLVKETLDRLILESIQLQMADRYGIRIPDEQLDAAVMRLADQNGMTLAQFQGAMEAEGRDYNGLREQLRQEMMLQRVQQGNVSRNIQISEQEVDNFMATDEGQLMTQPSFRVFQALLEVSSGDSDAVKADKEAFIDSSLAQILDGKSFEEAVTVTEPYTFSGGDLGWRPLDELPSMFKDIVPSLAPGQTGKVVSGAGYHLVYLADVRGRERLVQQTNVRHILIKPSEILSDTDAQALAVELRQRVLDGEDFATLAKTYSKDIGSAQEGGELGWTNPGQMVPEFEAAMADTDIGEVSEPVRSEFGWHILEVTDRREKDFAEQVARNQVTRYLHDQKYQEELDAWLRKIRAEAFVDIK